MQILIVTGKFEDEIKIRFCKNKWRWKNIAAKIRTQKNTEKDTQLVDPSSSHGLDPSAVVSYQISILFPSSLVFSSINESMPFYFMCIILFAKPPQSFFHNGNFILYLRNL